MQMYVFCEDKCQLWSFYSFEVMIFKYYMRGKIIKKYLQGLDIVMHVSNTGHNVFQELVSRLQARIDGVILKELNRKIFGLIKWIRQ